MKRSRSLMFTLGMVPVMSLALMACGGNDADGDNGGNAENNGGGAEENADTDTEENAEGNAEEGSDGEAAADSEAPEKPETLTMWVNDEEAQLDAYEDIITGFEEEHGIDVEITPYSMLDQTEGMSLDGPSGQGADLFFQPHDRLGDITLQGLAAELELTEDQQSRLDEYNEEAVTSFSYDGAQYGIPAVVETYALFYNTDLVEEAPETLDDLMAQAEELTDGDQYGFLMNATDFYFAYPFLTANGGYVFGQDDDGVYDPSDIGLNEPGAVEGGEMIGSWFEDGLMPGGVDLDVAGGLFSEGDAAMIVNGPWAIPEYEEALGDSLGVATLPTVDGEPVSSFSGNKGWLVNYYSENQYWATELALHITNQESSQTYFETAGELPAHTAVEVDDEFLAPIFDQTEYAEPMPNIPEMSQVWDPIAEALEFISQGEDPQEVLDEAVQQIEDQIAISQQ
ncbi:sugar ABC transporter substrate-binding protein [Alkalicoccus urumqiensis]|uniref:Maltodextrin-binding protein n=1 Tax=Alkalicoccus urumqiensis TaxID=1548213 RepID=A0A2P6MF30_ALKUR|nr:extracellular solute-binding protein [Alkalicoccus urumqiensis]PRO64857.1 ABC transporter substrate-binding protein [Alkalicoccus urumqiensis]